MSSSFGSLIIGTLSAILDTGRSNPGGCRFAIGILTISSISSTGLSCTGLFSFISIGSVVICFALQYFYECILTSELSFLNHNQDISSSLLNRVS